MAASRDESGPPRVHPRLRLGTSGYEYPHWRGSFYPEDLARKHWFSHYARVFDSLEINSTFYRLPAPEVFAAWRRQAPRNFEYAVKFSRYGSHLKRLLDPRGTTRRYYAAARRLGRRLGPTLLQLPPRWRADPPRLDAFLAAAPPSLRWAVEFRDPDWLRDEIFDILRRRRAALCIHDLLPEHPRELTADWTYLRYHGRPDAGSYERGFLRAEARRIAALLDRGCAVHAYFNNDAEAWAVRNALDLRRFIASELA
ncbi:MAG: DUF72 domain-containing protein [Gammaproteobacteria bacterium]|jgi:uncharacterized protein YecE (DUF72 family)|nr:DUF72 domain-containing protein [Gammaproteobacteria bacterium]